MKKRISLNELKPTQPDDKRRCTSGNPIKVCYDRGRYLVVDGHSRYYEALRQLGPNGIIEVEVVPNPYTDW